MRNFAFIVGLSLLVACEDGGGMPPPSLQPASIVVQNSSQYELTELRIHPDERFIDAKNLLEAPMGMDDEHLLFMRTGTYVTVMRERNRGGEQLALTTVEPIVIELQKGYRLLVFDDSFRLQGDPLQTRPKPEDEEMMMDEGDL